MEENKDIVLTEEWNKNFQMEKEMKNNGIFKFNKKSGVSICK